MSWRGLVFKKGFSEIVFKGISAIWYYLSIENRMLKKVMLQVTILKEVGKNFMKWNQWPEFIGISAEWDPQNRTYWQQSGSVNILAKQ